MHLLQGGYPKSGNYWLYTILQAVFQQKGYRQQSFIHRHPIYPLAQSWQLSYPEQVNINMLDILYEGCFLRISSRYREKIEDISKYIKQNTHVWTHSDYCGERAEVFHLFSKKIYIIRDVRDVLLSMANFAFSKYMQAYYPCWQKSPEQFLETEVTKISRHWAAHVGQYLREAKCLHLYPVFYEELLLNFEGELTKLAAYLEIDLTKKERKAIQAAVSPDYLKQKSPQHVGQPAVAKWKKKLAPRYQERLDRQAIQLLKNLNYPC